MLEYVVGERSINDLTQSQVAPVLLSLRYWIDMGLALLKIKWNELCRFRKTKLFKIDPNQSEYKSPRPFHSICVLCIDCHFAFLSYPNKTDTDDVISIWVNIFIILAPLKRMHYSISCNVICDATPAMEVYL